MNAGRLLAPGVATAGTLLLAGRVAAHAGSLGRSSGPVAVPEWLFLLTGGGVVAASFLFTSFATDREFLAWLHERRVPLGLPGSVRATVAAVGRAVGLLALAAVVVVGLLGPRVANANLAVLLVWAGWWAGYTITVYLVGNTWPTVSPWRTLADWLPRRGTHEYPDGLGAWPAVVALLALVWIEVVSPVTSDPRLLAGVVLAYTALTLAGAAVFGREDWFERVDPIDRVFRVYGHVAPLQRTSEGWALAMPRVGTGQALYAERGGVAFVVALLWATTYDGLTGTPAWADVATAAVGAGVPAVLLYPAVMAAGFLLFLVAYRWAARAARRSADSYVATEHVAVYFAPALVPIAAGYHLAHFLGYVLGLAPALGEAVLAPLSTAGPPTVLVLPGWFGGLALAFVIVGHLVAVWVAHATAFEVFTGRLQPIRSQYPYVVLMVGYTMTSLWIVSQPFVTPPYT